MSLKKEESQSTFSLDQLLQINRKTPKAPSQAPAAPTTITTMIPQTSAETKTKKPRKKTATKDKTQDEVTQPKKRAPKKSKTTAEVPKKPTKDSINTIQNDSEKSEACNENNPETRSSLQNSEIERKRVSLQNSEKTRFSIRNSDNLSEGNGELSASVNVKSYGVGINKEKEINETADEHLILHIPVVLGSRNQKSRQTTHSQSSVSDSQILAYATDIIQDNLKTTNKTKDCEQCFITEDGSLLYCDRCTQLFNQKQQAQRNFEKMQEDRKNDDNMYKQIYAECELDLPHIQETKMEKDTPLPVYDPEDVQSNSIGAPLIHIKPTSLINQELDDQAPTRDQYEKLKCEYELLQQRYLKSLKDNRATPNGSDEITNSVWKDRLRIIDLMKRAKIKVTKSFELPIIFGNKNDPWPTRVPICCMFDAHPFDSVPIPLPLSYNSVSDSFRVFGCFCSVQCALGFKKANKSLEHVDTSLFFFFLNKLQDEVGKFIPDGITINPAPNPYTLLDIYGGPMTIDEFRSISQSYSLQSEIITFPLEPVPQFLQVTNQLVNAELDASLLDFNNIDNKRVKKLKIQRNKPLPNHKNRLEASMGLMIDDQIVN